MNRNIRGGGLKNAAAIIHACQIYIISRGAPTKIEVSLGLRAWWPPQVSLLSLKTSHNSLTHSNSILKKKSALKPKTELESNVKKKLHISKDRPIYILLPSTTTKILISNFFSVQAHN